MKTRSAITIILLMFGVASISRAQSGMSTENWQDIRVGPMFTAGESINAGDVTTGTKTGTQFAFTAGAFGLYPFTSNIGFLLGLAYDSRGVNFHPENDVNTYVDYTFSYFSIQPMFDLGGFTIGVGLGVPIGASVSVASTSLYPNGVTQSTSSMNFMVEGRIGGAIPIFSNDHGDLRLLLSAAYPFTKIVQNQYLFGGDATHNNGPLATGQIGLTYLFDLTPH
ncbi:MAG TPA: hypothetical protein VG537_04250 [Candidatus Kapabacteria bacterium]|nr:hypothetical protein [Candidatus Kapabacteria bacterium]